MVDVGEMSRLTGGLASDCGVEIVSWFRFGGGYSRANDRGALALVALSGAWPVAWK